MAGLQDDTGRGDGDEHDGDEGVGLGWTTFRNDLLSKKHGTKLSRKLLIEIELISNIYTTGVSS